MPERKNRKRSMPRRPVQHVHEDRSRRALEIAIPDEWVFRPQDHDYGIDGELEVFESERAAALVFKVQLKATGEPNLKKALRVRIPNDKVEYYAALRLPILIVRYHVPTRTLYGRWFHSFDPHYGGKNEKSITLKFGTGDRLQEDRWSSIAADAAMFYQIRDAKTALPSQFQILYDTQTVRGVRSDSLAVTIRGHASKFPDLLRVDKEEPNSGVASTIQLRDEATVVTFRDVASVTAHCNEGEDAPDIGTAANDVMLAIALAFDHIGQTNAAARIVASCAYDSSLLFSPDVMFHVLGILTRAHRISEAVALSRRFGEVGELESDALADLFLTPALLRSSTLSTFEKDSVTDGLRERVRAAESRGRDFDLAVAHYNLGNHLRSKAAWVEAITHYALAAKHDPHYLDRDYFPREFGGALYEADEFELSAEMYGRALQLGAPGMVLALRADALMLAGRYVDAEDTFRSYNDLRGMAGEPEWRLKGATLPVIREWGGDEQGRQIDEAMRCSDVSHPDLTDAEVRIRLEKALRLDALCPGAWFNLGLLRLRMGEAGGAFEAFLLAAIIARHDVEAWTAAIVLGDHTSQLVSDAASCAYRFGGEAFIAGLADRLAAIDDPAYPRDELLVVVDAAASAVQRQSPGATEIRIILDDGNYESFVIGGSSDDDDEEEGPEPQSST